MERESIAKQLRWKIYARDGFSCRYCGRKPPDAVLHIDHVQAVSRGGINDEENLVTACQDCNLSKGANPIPEPAPASKTRLTVPLESVEQVAAITAELPRTTARLYEFFMAEAGSYENRGHPVTVAMPVLVMAALDAAAWLYLRLATSSKTKRDFMAMCATMFDEHKGAP